MRISEIREESLKMDKTRIMTIERSVSERWGKRLEEGGGERKLRKWMSERKMRFNDT